MDHIRISRLICVGLLALAVCSGSVLADAEADLEAALKELRKDAGNRDEALVDRSLAAAAAMPAELAPDRYGAARSLQEQRRVDALTGKTRPQKRPP